MDASLEPEQFVRELEATAELGAHHIIAQLPDPNRGRAVDRFARLCDLAKPLGMCVDLEFPHWTSSRRCRANIPYSLEIPRVTLTRAIGPEEVARLALTITRSYVDETQPAAVAATH